MTVSAWIKRHTHSLIGKTVAITGATGGLGKALTEHLATLGADLILLDRNQEKSKALENDLKSAHPNVTVTRISVDMEDFSAVKRATATLLTAPPDYLILNAGAYAIPRHKTDLGYDNVFQINAIAPYYMARKLQNAIADRGGKIVAVGSIAHNYSKTDPDDLDFSKRSKASHVYGNAKRYLTYGLFALDHNSTITVAHPGITFTNITAHYPKVIFALIKHPMKLIFHSTQKASLSILAGLFTPSSGNEWIGPRLSDIWGIPKKRPLKTAAPEEAAAIAKAMDEIYRNLDLAAP